MTRRADDLIVREDILLSTIQSDDVRCNVGDNTTSAGFASACSTWGPDGFISVPVNPTTDGCAEALVWRDGDQRCVIGTRDHRFAARTGNLASGDRLIITESSARVVIKNAKGTVAMYTTHDKTDSGRPIYSWVHPEKGWEVVTPWGYVSFGPLGFHMEHYPSGTEMHFGAASGIPSPLNALGGYAQVNAGNGMLSLKGAIVNIGSDGGAAHNLALTALKSLLVSTEAFAVAVNVALATAVPTSGITAANLTALASATTALTAAQTASAALINQLGQVV